MAPKHASRPLCLQHRPRPSPSLSLWICVLPRYPNLHVLNVQSGVFDQSDVFSSGLHLRTDFVPAFDASGQSFALLGTTGACVRGSDCVSWGSDSYVEDFGFSVSPGHLVGDFDSADASALRAFACRSRDPAENCPYVLDP